MSRTRSSRWAGLARTRTHVPYYQPDILYHPPQRETTERTACLSPRASQVWPWPFLRAGKAGACVQSKTSRTRRNGQDCVLAVLFPLPVQGHDQATTCPAPVTLCRGAPLLSPVRPWPKGDPRWTTYRPRKSVHLLSMQGRGCETAPAGSCRQKPPHRRCRMPPQEGGIRPPSRFQA